MSDFAIRLAPAQVVIFDTFLDAAGRDVHRQGGIASALIAKVADLFSESPRIEQGAIVASKFATA